MSLCGNNNPCPDLITGQKCGITYTGARYVPLFADPAQWDNTKTYEPLTIVLNEGNSYTSKTFVPIGVDISNEKYWALTGNYNAQVEAYREEVRQLKGKVEIRVIKYLNVSSMLADVNLVTGDVVLTAGYYTPNDLGGAMYTIVSTIPSGFYETLSNGLYAELIINDFIRPEMIGANGDGVTDDTSYFTKIFSNEQVKIVLDKEYLVTNNVISCEWTNIDIDGNGTIYWNNSAGTSLIDIKDINKYFSIKNVNIIAKNTGGYVFNIHASSTIDPEGGVLKPLFNNIRFNGKVDYVFFISGNRQCDRMLVSNCTFEAFLNFYKSTNKESVANTFTSCSFFSSNANTIYFEFSVCYDEFTVENCSFSIYVSNQTLIKTTEVSQDYKYNFVRNRYEFYTGTSESFTLIEAKNGMFTFKDSTMFGAGTAVPALIMNFTENSVACIKNCKFDQVTINVGESTGSVVPVYSRFIEFDGCQFQKNPIITYATNYVKRVIFRCCEFPSLKGITYNAYSDFKGSNLCGDLSLIRLLPFNNYPTLPPKLAVERIVLYKTFATSNLTINYTINGTQYPVTFADGANTSTFIDFKGVIESFSSDNNTAAIYITLISGAEMLNL